MGWPVGNGLPPLFFMAFTFTVETGAGLAGSNSYASVAEADDYHAASMSNAVWAALSTEAKQAALAMATRVLDASFQFNGYQKLTTQALQWPRILARNKDGYAGVYLGGAVSTSSAGYWADDAVPKPVKDATAEMARLLTVTDRTAEADGVGLKKVEVFEAVAVEFDGRGRNTVPNYVAELLRGVGTMIGGKGVNAVRIERA